MITAAARPQTIIRTYLVLTLFNTLAASMIWGINTLFLLNAGLSLTEAFGANAFFTAGMVLFQVPTGVIADAKGRRLSYLLGAATLAASTFVYFIMWQIHAPFIGWAIASLAIGLGFTFFSGATDAWLVDALNDMNYDQPLDNVFAKAQVIGGISMLFGSVLGGVVAQFTNLGVPYILRTVLLLVTFIIAAIYMKDIGFNPDSSGTYIQKTKRIVAASVKYGFRNPPVRWMMLAAPFSAGVGIYVFYALQPYLLGLYGDQKAYWIAGLTAAIVAGAQIVGGILVPRVRKLVKNRTTLLIIGSLISSVILALIALLPNFYSVIALVVLWALVFASVGPVRQSYLNNLIPSQQRATVLSIDALLGSSGGVVTQPVLGKTAEVFGYGPSYMVSGVIQLAALPFLLLAGRIERSKTKVS
jgi:MFS family permease